jgi:hypothetical protein
MTKRSYAFALCFCIILKGANKTADELFHQYYFFARSTMVFASLGLPSINHLLLEMELSASTPFLILGEQLRLISNFVKYMGPNVGTSNTTVICFLKLRL